MIIARTTAHSKVQISKWKQLIEEKWGRKEKNILLLTHSLLKKLLMGGFNKLLKEGTAYLKSFPGAKAKEFNYHSTTILSEHQYNAAVTLVGINDLVNI